MRRRKTTIRHVEKNISLKKKNILSRFKIYKILLYVLKTFKCYDSNSYIKMRHKSCTYYALHRFKNSIHNSVSNSINNSIHNRHDAAILQRYINKVFHKKFKENQNFIIKSFKFKNDIVSTDSPLKNQ